MITGYFASEHFIANSDGVICDHPPYLDFLLDNNPGDIKIFYDIDANVASVLQLIGISEAEAKKLHDKEKLHFGPYKLAYFPGVFFGIDSNSPQGKSFVNFSGANQYKDTHFAPDNSQEYAIAKAQEAKEVGLEAQQAFTYLGLPTDNISSPIAAFKKQLEILDIPDFLTMPDEAADWAKDAMKGSLVQANQVGYWDKAFDYDINASYPYELSKLLDLRRGRWVKRPYPLEQAVYGFAQGIITTNANFHPFLYRKGAGMPYTPVGSWQTCLTLQEYDFLYDYKLGEFEATEGWWLWLPTEPAYHLFEGVVRWLYAKRNGTTGLTKLVIRRISSACWGKLSETRKGRPGPHWQPCYASVVEANARIRLVKTCLDYGVEHILHCAVDGFISDEKLPLKTSMEFGDWRLSGEGRCLINGTGVVAFEGNNGAGDFSLKFDWLNDQIKAHPKAQSYTMEKHSVIGLGLALANNGVNFDYLGKVVRKSRAVCIGEDTKRFWGERPKTGGQLLSGHKWISEPVPLSLIAGLGNNLGGEE